MELKDVADGMDVTQSYGDEIVLDADEDEKKLFATPSCSRGKKRSFTVIF